MDEGTRNGLAEMFGGAYQDVAQPVIGTGFASLDDALGGGLYPGVYFLAGMPGAGKTTLATQICAKARSDAGTLTSFLELEMGEAAINVKLLQAIAASTGDGPSSWISQDDIGNAETLEGEKAKVLGDAVSRFLSEQNRLDESENTLFEPRYLADSMRDEGYPDWPCLDDEGQPAGYENGHGGFTNEREFGWTDNPLYKARRADMFMFAFKQKQNVDWALKEERAAWLRQAVSTNQECLAKAGRFESGIRGELAVVDYLQAIRDDRYPKDDTGRIVEAIEDLKTMVRESSRPLAVLAITSFSRSGYKDPTAFASMAGSSAIEYAAEGIMVLAEDAGYIPSQKVSEWMQGTGMKRMKLTVTKNRHGRSGQSIPLWFDGAHGCFIETKTNK